MWHAAEKAEISEANWIYVCMFQHNLSFGECDSFISLFYLTISISMSIRKEQCGMHNNIPTIVVL
jgi:hypothetical protein